MMMVVMMKASLGSPLTAPRRRWSDYRGGYSQ
jgi:hypothetical protein